jgi:hypothetical protein
MPFDEGRLWKGSDGLALREELRSAFVNITRIMDCVGCEKCKLWGKLQTLGGWAGSQVANLERKGSDELARHVPRDGTVHVIPRTKKVPKPSRHEPPGGWVGGQGIRRLLCC